MDAVDSNIRIYVHKETELADVEKKLPAEHYVVIDDKLRLLAAIKQQWGERVTTIFVNQGHYAHDPKNLAMSPAADLRLERIGDVLQLGPAQFRPNPNNVVGSKSSAAG